MRRIIDHLLIKYDQPLLFIESYDCVYVFIDILKSFTFILLVCEMVHGYCFGG